MGEKPMKKTPTGAEPATLSEMLGSQVFAYLRVSTAEQDEGAQLIGINNYLKTKGVTKKKIIKDKVSGSTPWRQRALAQLEELAGRGDWLIVSELSRIGRTTSDVLDFLAWASKKGLQIYAVKNGLTIDDTIQSKIFTTILALTAEIEREFIRARTREGMAYAKALGKKIGRPTGPAKSHQLDIHKEDIQSLIQKKVPKAAIARIHAVSIGTINRALKCWESEGVIENG